MHGKAFVKMAGTVILAFGLLGGLLYGNRAYGVLLAIVLAIVGIGIGGSTFWLLDRLAAKRPENLIRLISAVIATLVAHIAGYWTGWAIYTVFNAERICAHSRLAVLNLSITALIGAVITGAVGLLFGTGLGQSKKPQ